MLSPVKAKRSATTATKAAAKTKVRQPPVKPGGRVKARRSKVYHLLNPEQQKYLPKEHPNFHNYFGTVVKKSLGRKAAYDIQFDVFRGGETAV